VAELWRRAWDVTVDGTRLDGLDVSFEVEKSTAREPNKATLRIWNLSPTRRQSLEGLTTTRGAARIRVEIVAGYKDQAGLIFRGDLRSALTSRQGPDLVTTLEGEDGGRSVLSSRVSRSFPAGTTAAVVVRACAEALGVGLGNALDAVAQAQFTGGGNTFREGTTLSGQASEELHGLFRSLGLTHSIQNGVLQVQRRGQALQATAVRLAPETGLIGRPEVDVGGLVKLQSLMNPDIYPGRVLQLDPGPGIRPSGFFQAKKVIYRGDTAGNDWLCEVEART
jgi:hypothetical protein